MNSLRRSVGSLRSRTPQEAEDVKSSRWRGTALGLGSIVSVIALLMMTGPQMGAQSSNAELSGVITDTSGAVLAGAGIKALNTATNVTYAAVTNGSGLYLLTEL